MSNDITGMIRESEHKLQDIVNYAHRSDTDKKVKENVESVIARKLRELTNTMRKDQ